MYQFKKQGRVRSQAKISNKRAESVTNQQTEDRVESQTRVETGISGSSRGKERARSEHKYRNRTWSEADDHASIPLNYVIL